MATGIPGSSQETAQDVRQGGWSVLGLLIAAGPICYGIGLGAASFVDAKPWTEVACFDQADTSHFVPARLLIAVVTAVGAIAFLIVTPWILAVLAIGRIERRKETAGAWSLAANSAALILLCLLLRNTVGINRGSLMVSWLAWTVLLAVFSGNPARSAGRIRSGIPRWGPAMVIGLAALIAAVFVVRRELFLQCFNGDGTEFSQLAGSLRYHFLPHWEIETVGRFGTFVANPTLINSYWTLGLQLLMGEGEPATRMSCWIWWLAIFAVSLRVVQGDSVQHAWYRAIPLSLAILLTSVWYAFYVGYYPYMADLANPAVPDALFTLLLLLALNCLRCGDCAGWVVSMILASLVFYAGGVMLLLMAGAAWGWQPVARRQILRATLIAMLVLLGIACSYLVVGWHEGSLPGWWSTMDREWFCKYLTPGPQGNLRLLYVAYFLLGCGVVPAISLLSVFGKNSGRRDIAWDRTAATVTLIYLLIIMGSGHKNLHYLYPLLPIPLILWLKLPRRQVHLGRKEWIAPLTATAGLAVCIVLCWPVSRPTFTLNRQLGTVTTFQTHSYEEACRWAPIGKKLYADGCLGWYIGPHTWVHYSQLDGDLQCPRPLVVTRGGPPSSEYRLVAQSAGPALEYLKAPGRQVEGARVFCRDPQLVAWMANQRPQSGPDRCPWVFRPIAIAPFPRSTD